MNWEAVFAIGIVFALPALVLMPLGLWLVRRFARKDVKGDSALVITRIGFVYFGAFVALLLFGLTVSTILKGTWLERTIGGGGVTMAYYGLLVAASVIVERHLKRRGIVISRHRKGVDA